VLTPRTERIAGAILIGIVLCEAIPLVFAIRGLDRVLLHPQPAVGVLGAMVVAAAYIWYSARVPGIRRHLGNRSWLRVPAIVLAVTAGIVEEVYFRRVLMDALQSVGIGPFIQILVSGVTFGAFHAIWGVRGGWRVVRGAVVATSLLGFALATLYIAAGRVLVPCIEAHILIDLVLEPALVIFAVEARGRRNAAPGAAASAT
jgi:CAAX protease family protein